MLRVRKSRRVAGVRLTLTPRGVSARVGRGPAGVSLSSRGVSGSVRLVPGVTLWKRLRGKS